MSVIMVSSKSVIAQTIETMKGPEAPDQLQIGGHPEDIEVNSVTNKIYILSPTDGTITVLDSKSGTVKNIPVGSGFGSPQLSCAPGCMAIDPSKNKIYVANTGADTVSVIDGYSGTVKSTVPVGSSPVFVIFHRSIPETYDKIYVANLVYGTVSVIASNNDTVVKTIQVGLSPRFMLDDDIDLYVACSDGVYVIDPKEDTVVQHITLPGNIELVLRSFSFVYRPYMASSSGAMD